jgi:hypothetical protein
MAPAHLDTGDDINLIFGLLSAILALLAIAFTAATWKLQRQAQRIERVQFQQIVLFANIVLPQKEISSKTVYVWSEPLSADFGKGFTAPPRYNDTMTNGTQFGDPHNDHQCDWSARNTTLDGS